VKIAILGARGMPSTYGGYETFIQELAPALAEMGHQVTVYCRRKLFAERPRVYKGVRLVYLPSIETKNLGTLTHTAIATLHVLMSDADVSLLVNPANGWYCLPHRLLGKKVAINLDGLEWKRGKWSILGKLYFRCAARVAVLFANELVNDAEAMRTFYQETWGRDSTFIAYGAYIEKSEHPEMLMEYGLEPGRYLLIASRLVPDNNADLIVRAFEGVKTTMNLAIAGGANYRSPFVDELKNTSDPRVKFLGHVDKDQHVKELHCNAYAYIHGHEFGGTNPALLKALGYGNCILALNTPFNREVLGDYGVLFDKSVGSLKEKLQHIVGHPEIAEGFRHRASCRIKEAYSWESIADKYEVLFQRMISS
jgi:glycosyltransferase involved in cell wall biosynthesis